jgi:hypothetical protein
MGVMKMHTKLWSENLKERGNFENLDVKQRKILR